MGYCAYCKMVAKSLLDDKLKKMQNESNDDKCICVNSGYNKLTQIWGS